MRADRRTLSLIDGVDLDRSQRISCNSCNRVLSCHPHPGSAVQLLRRECEARVWTVACGSVDRSIVRSALTTYSHAAIALCPSSFVIATAWNVDACRDRALRHGIQNSSNCSQSRNSSSIFEITIIYSSSYQYTHVPLTHTSRSA